MHQEHGQTRGRTDNAARKANGEIFFHFPDARHRSVLVARQQSFIIR
jgi:hypothetical protein